MADAVLCLANSRGGTVVVGVRNHETGPAAFAGTRLDAELTRRRIYELTQPAVLVNAALEELQGVPLLVIEVPIGIDVHTDTKGRAPRRLGTDCLPMSAQEQARLREERLGIDWSVAETELDPRAISEQALQIARRRLGAFTDKRRELSALDDGDLLRALGAVSSGAAVTRAGALLFAQPTDDASPSIVYQYRVSPGGEPAVIERLGPPLIVAFERILQLIVARRNLTAVTLPDGQQIHIEDFPDLAVREALANAVIHREYSLKSPVSIEHSPEVFVVDSPGPLVAGVTPENIITHPSKPRNPLLARMARTVGLAEEIGRGVDRMYREMIRSGRDIPRIASGPDHVRVTLVGGAPNTHLARYIAQLPDLEREDTDALLALFSLRSRRTMTASYLAPVLQKTPEEAEAALRRLADDSVGMIEPTRESARRRYPSYRLRGTALKALGSAVAYQRRTTDEIDRKVIEHVREYGKVTNRTIRNLLDVSVSRAAAIVGDLVKREILVKTSEAQRGPTVEYGAGSRFPTARRQKPSAQEAEATLFDDA